MIIALDVAYAPDHALTAAVGFVTWTAEDFALRKVKLTSGAPAPYEPGAFYKRELPYLIDMLRSYAPTVVVIDGYVRIGDQPALGAHLFEALGRAVPVVGVAKSFMKDSTGVEVLRGDSLRPLYVTAEGLDAGAAADAVRSMHGAHRIPTHLKHVDQLTRGRSHS